MKNLENENIAIPFPARAARLAEWAFSPRLAQSCPISNRRLLRARVSELRQSRCCAIRQCPYLKTSSLPGRDPRSLPRIEIAA